MLLQERQLQEHCSGPGILRAWLCSLHSTCGSPLRSEVGSQGALKNHKHDPNENWYFVTLQQPFIEMPQALEGLAPAAGPALRQGPTPKPKAKAKARLKGLSRLGSRAFKGYPFRVPY